MKRLLILISVAALAAFFVACGGDDDDAGAATTAPATTAAGSASATEAPEATPFPDSGPTTLRLGFFANITHSQPLVGLNNGIFEEELGDDVTVEQTTFNAGPSVIEALFAGEIDASFIGPNPAINGYIQSGGEALRIVAGATSGGALFIVNPDLGISEPEDFAGKKIASPQLGNTQDVALRTWLAENGVTADVQPVANADALSLFQQGELDGAWVPEPWGTRLIQEAGGELYLNEGDLWPDGRYVTTHLAVSTDFLEEHPDVVYELVTATVKTTEWINDNSEEAKTIVNEQIEAISGAALPAEVINAAWENIEITYDPVQSSLLKSAEDAYALGYLESEPDLDGIYSLDILRRVLAEQGLPPIEG